MTPINRKTLLELGFVKSAWNPHIVLVWRGAPLKWDGNRLNYAGKDLNLATIEEVKDFIRSLQLKKTRGVKAI
jgi:hypothetical protein